MTRDELQRLHSRGPDGRSTDFPRGGGVPPWLAGTLRHCSRCGGRLDLAPVPGDERDRLTCSNCGHITYVNPRLVVTTLPLTEDGRLYLIRRGFEPGRGLWAQPGGFLEVDETVTEGAVRETLEETGLEVAPGEIVGLYARLEAAVIVLVYEARVVGGAARTSPEALEVVAFDPADIPWPDIAFRTTFYALSDWVMLRRPDITPPAPHWPGGGAG
ncbi:MAG TPA: NUDIX hydrolase [Candidatus Binatia bacterium]|nr:NUDIX hydrolase [Candidatus Binatia bacterium]